MNALYLIIFSTYKIDHLINETGITNMTMFLICVVWVLLVFLLTKTKIYRKYIKR